MFSVSHHTDVCQNPSGIRAKFEFAAGGRFFCTMLPVPNTFTVTLAAAGNVLSSFLCITCTAVTSKSIIRILSNIQVGSKSTSDSRSNCHLPACCMCGVCVWCVCLWRSGSWTSSCHMSQRQWKCCLTSPSSWTEPSVSSARLCLVSTCTQPQTMEGNHDTVSQSSNKKSQSNNSRILLMPSRSCPVEFVACLF